MGPCLYTPLAVTSLKTYPANLQDGNKASVYPVTQAASFTAEFALQPKMGILTDLPYPYLSTNSDDSVLPTQSSNIKTLFKLEGMVFHSTGVLLISYGNDKSSKPLLKQNEHYTTFCPVRQPLTQFIQQSCLTNKVRCYLSIGWIWRHRHSWFFLSSLLYVPPQNSSP